MKRFNLLVIIGLAVFAGYLLYPFFNHVKDSADLTSSEVLPKEQESAVHPNEDTEKRKSITPRVIKIEKPQRLPEQSVSVGNENNTDQTNQNGSDNFERKRNSRRGYGNFKTFSGQGAPRTIRDFSFYKLKKMDERLPISEDDPRLILIQGIYTGLYEGDSYELEIGRLITLRINDVRLVIGGPSETLLSNVNDNGNSIEIENGKNKTYINIKNWPTLTLSIGPIKTIRLTKF